ncbi:Odorant receptor 329 [Nylanderia fulva]|uniref:Odorant receptor n=1 Tax=Nylanderia fulva TaxID=613905 RepID=A0A6G1LPZ0_9HYME|nr:Odorant receptor 329 [Nylanderia fulva]
MSFKNSNHKYFDLTMNKILLLILGIWPYRQSHLIRFQFICLSSILATNIIFQCTVFASHKCTLDLVIKVLSSVFPFVFCITKYNLFSFKLKAMKDMFEQLFHACNKLKNANEIAIIDEYGYFAKRYTIILTTLSTLSMLVFILLPFLPDIFNTILRTNLTRSQNLLIVEYFINQEKYFYLILLHYIASFCIALISMVAIGTILLTYLQLTCGMFKIASYRLECAMSINMLQNVNFRKNILICKGLICAVDIHRQAMKLSTIFQSNCEIMLFFLIIFGVLTISFNLFRIASSKENLEEISISFINTAVFFVYMFLSNYCGQIIIDHSHQVFVTAYNIRWYLAPVCVQKIILFLLQRGMKTFSVNIGGLYDGSIEGFATLAKASVSYFTVIYSTR